MKKPSFLGQPRPLLCAMVQEKTPQDAIAVIMNSLYDGAEAFGIQLEYLEREYRDEKTLREIFSHCGQRPIYITSYRGAENRGMSDGECVELLLRGLAAGATLLDVIGDLFCPEPHELTMDPVAVAKQEALIRTIHEKGGEALISSHLHAFYDEEEVMRIAFEQKKRGADVVKIVTRADTRAELMTDLRIADRLGRELGKEHLFLAGGSECRLLRQVGPAFGSCMYLTVERYQPQSSKEQPLLRAAKAIRDAMTI